MDITRYSKQLQEYYREHQHHLQLGNREACSVLRKMLKIAVAENDPELIGYLYHSLAFAEYFIMGRYDAFLKNLRLSAKYILQCEDQTEFLHIYYLIAIDAMNKGNYDIAHHYFLEARSIAEKASLITEMEILEESIAYVMMRIGDNRRALTYAKLSLSRIRKDKSHPHYFNNLITGYLGEAIAYLRLHQITQAKTVKEKVDRFYAAHPEEFQDDILLDYLLLSYHLMVEEGGADKKKEKALFREVCEMVQKIPNLHMYMNAIRILCDTLKENRCNRQVGMLIEAMEKNTVAPNAVHALQLLINLKIDYYLSTGKREELPDCYAEQDRIYARVLAERKEMYEYTRELVKLTGELRKGREAALAEKEKLLYRSYTDALTGVMNRYAGVIRLGELFEKAIPERKRVGIVYLDVDELKHYNDAFGHPEGDRRLSELGKLLRSREKEDGFRASRFGGDEFILIFDDANTARIEECVKNLQEQSPIGFSAGICNAIPEEGESMWDFIAQADKALYREKKKRRNRSR